MLTKDKILFSCPGRLLFPNTNRWHVGLWQTKESSLIFLNKTKCLWFSSYCQINSVRIENNSLLIVCYEQDPPYIWLRTDDLHFLKNYIVQRAYPKPILEQQINHIATQVDFESEQLLWYFWENKSASLDELMTLGITNDPVEILKRIKKMLNPLAQKLFGIPLFIFRSKRWYLYDPRHNFASEVT